MSLPYFLDEGAANIALFEALLKPLQSPFIHWKPNPDRWSVLEIVCHLVDEEREDFRNRVLFALEKKSGLPASIDPPGWVISRNYAQQDFTKKLAEFLQERRYSLQLLESFSDADWSRSFQHPKLGSLSALYLLENWLAHDLLHIKQILRLRYDYLIQLSGNTLDYAGAWT